VENPNDNILLRQLLDLIIESHDELIDVFLAKKDSLKKKRDLVSQTIALLWNDVNDANSLWQVLCGKANVDPFIAKLKKDCLDQIVNLLDNAISGKRNSLPQFMEKSALFVAPGRSPKGLISEIREWKADRLGSQVSASYSPVNIYNMPSSKGLEADVVFVVGASEELMPSLKGNLEEESRLFYVAMTRAKRELYLFNARKRPANITFHPASYQLARSRFVKAIPTKYIEIRYIKKKI
jgi:UvrD-like helicase C-terminal domain